MKKRGKRTRKIKNQKDSRFLPRGSREEMGWSDKLDATLAENESEPCRGGKDKHQRK